MTKGKDKDRPPISAAPPEPTTSADGAPPEPTTSADGAPPEPTTAVAGAPPEPTTNAAVETAAPTEAPKAKAVPVTFRISGSVRKAIEGAQTFTELHEAVAGLKPAERGSIEALIYEARRRIVRAGG